MHHQPSWLGALALFTALAAPLTASAGASLLVNGSFEDGPTVSPGTWHIQTDIPGWSGDPSSDPLGDGGIELRNNYDGTAQDGVHFVELDTFRNSWMQQSVATTAGEHYTLSWYYSPRPRTGLRTNGIQVMWNGVVVFENDGDGSNLSDHAWQQFSVDLVGTGGLNDLRFSAFGVSDQLGGSLDNITLTAATAVPAPASLALVLGGLALLRRRRT